jgi:hypothetical protein
MHNIIESIVMVLSIIIMCIGVGEFSFLLGGLYTDISAITD